MTHSSSCKLIILMFAAAFVFSTIFFFTLLVKVSYFPSQLKLPHSVIDNYLTCFSTSCFRFCMRHFLSEFMLFFAFATQSWMNELWYACAKPFGVYKQGLHAEGHMTSHRGAFRDKGFPKGCLSPFILMQCMTCLATMTDCQGYFLFVMVGNLLWIKCIVLMFFFYNYWMDPFMKSCKKKSTYHHSDL